MKRHINLHFDRFSLPDLCSGNNLLGIELGVASGDFSLHMVRSGRFSCFFGVDKYSDHHNTNEYRNTLELIGVFEHYKLLRMTFEEALPLFPDETFDFVYVDGYAHTGEEGGKTIASWLSKVKIGGVLAGHDYHPDWPLVVTAVHELCERTGFELMVTQKTESGGRLDKYPSWAIVKTCKVNVELPSYLSRAAEESWLGSTGTDPYSLPLFPNRVKEAINLLLGRRASLFMRSLSRKN